MVLDSANIFAQYSQRTASSLAQRYRLQLKFVVATGRKPNDIASSLILSRRRRTRFALPSPAYNGCVESLVSAAKHANCRPTRLHGIVRLSLPTKLRKSLNCGPWIYMPNFQYLQLTGNLTNSSFCTPRLAYSLQNVRVVEFSRLTYGTLKCGKLINACFV